MVAGFGLRNHVPCKQKHHQRSEKRLSMKQKLFFSSLALVLVLQCGIALQAKTFQLTSSPTTPAASGKVEVKKDKNGNTTVEISAEHLAKPGMLTPPATDYVVWFREEGGEPVNQGQLRVAKSLRGEFKTTTRFQNFEVFVTAESDPQVKLPSGDSVLKTKVQNL
jgi:hypothetical protein